MKKNVAGIFTLCLLIAGCSGRADDHSVPAQTDAHSSTDEIVFTLRQAEMVGLQVEEVTPGAFNQVIKTSGQILPATGDEVTIVATTPGTVAFTRPAITEGTAVGAGETIAIISSNNLLDGDPLRKAKIAYETAESDYLRAQELVEDQIISVREFEQTRLRYETARAAYETQAGGHSDRGMRVVAPVGGYIKSRLVNEGEYVAVGQPIAVVAQNRRMQLRAEVSGNYFGALKSIRSAHFRTAYNDVLYKLPDLNGRLLSFGKASDGQSYYIPVIFEFDNVSDIVGGSFVTIYLLSRPLEDVIVVPVSAITEEQGLYFVYLQVDDEGYRKQEVILGQSDGGSVRILKGLNAGDRVVTKGVYQVKLAAVSPAMPEGHSH
ncbi:MAG: efflux RND transporter periplasmic adaptor subunit [Prevotellaceae bacterium]|jgi:RND family efflux transporter MFP subunit|nr:efflux RND transporter periplasmic adaptor subunit [Prevotellaceae bacterium]